MLARVCMCFYVCLFYFIYFKIERIQNLQEHKQYCARKGVMSQRNMKIINEKYLFHATSDINTESICVEGFHRALAGTSNG